MFSVRPIFLVLFLCFVCTFRIIRWSFNFKSASSVAIYDVSNYFPTDSRFEGLLISPRGVEIHRKNCSIENQNCCECQLYICVDNGCLTALKKNSKFAIANGNYIGRLP
jgi:hypothetical protein